MRFLLDLSAIVSFLKELLFFMKLKVQKLMATNRQFTTFHKMVTLSHYIQ